MGKREDSAAAAGPAADAPQKQPVGRPPKKADARPRERRRDHELATAAAAAAGLDEPLGDRLRSEPDRFDPQGGRGSREGEKRKQLDGKEQELAFLNAIYFMKETGKGAATTAGGERRRQAAVAKAAAYVLALMTQTRILFAQLLGTACCVGSSALNKQVGHISSK